MISVSIICFRISLVRLSDIPIYSLISTFLAEGLSVRYSTINAILSAVFYRRFFIRSFHRCIKIKRLNDKNLCIEFTQVFHIQYIFSIIRKITNQHNCLKAIVFILLIAPKILLIPLPFHIHPLKLNSNMHQFDHTVFLL